LDQKEDEYFNRAVAAIDVAVKSLYGNQYVSLQQLSATFRRGDLISKLGATP
jgi:hypothetical protein